MVAWSGKCTKKDVGQNRSTWHWSIMIDQCVQCNPRKARTRLFILGSVLCLPLAGQQANIFNRREHGCSRLLSRLESRDSLYRPSQALSSKIAQAHELLRFYDTARAQLSLQIVSVRISGCCWSFRNLAFNQSADQEQHPPANTDWQTHTVRSERVPDRNEVYFRSLDI